MRSRYLIGFGLLLIIIGSVVFTIGFIQNDYKFSVYGKQHGFCEETKNFSSNLIIDVDVDESRVYLIKSTTDEVVVKWHQSDKYQVTVEEADGKLTIKSHSDYHFMDYIFYSWQGWHEGYILEIAIPDNYQEEIKIHNKTGYTKIDSVKCDKKINVTSETGAIIVKNLSAPHLDAYIKTGHLEIEKGEISTAKCIGTTGNIELEEVTIDELEIELTTGNVKVSEISVTLLKVTNATGNIKIDECIVDILETINRTGNTTVADTLINTSVKCHATTGNITAYFENHRNDFTVFTTVGSGHCNIGSGGNGHIKMDVAVKTGRISVKFKN